ncbi:MAG: DUF975 family protein [Clostridia bacterium]|nr:DUF975 family protein [Clostridia bacterium]
MRTSSELRRIALNALRSKWVMAIIMCIIVTFLGGVNSEGIEFKINFEANHPNFGVYLGDHTIYSSHHGFIPEGLGIIAGGFAVLAIFYAILRFMLGSIAGIGYARFNLDLVNNTNPNYGSLLRYFPYWKSAICTAIAKALRIFLWTLLFVIPGIVASYSYAMTNYILAETPNIKESEAIEISKVLMQGNKWRLFCLRLSFIGWDILAAFTLGIANIFIVPYKQAAEAAFYMDITTKNYTSFE